MHVGQAEVAAGVAVGEAFVVEAHLVQQRGVNVMRLFCTKLRTGISQRGIGFSFSPHRHAFTLTVSVCAWLARSVFRLPFFVSAYSFSI